MTDEMDGKDLAERVRLIESMMAEGRHGTERWGWSFVLWGVAYLVATAWSSGLVGGPVWAQPASRRQRADNARNFPRCCFMRKGKEYQRNSCQ